MGSKPRMPREWQIKKDDLGNEVLVRSQKSLAVWEGSDPSGPVRVVAIDNHSNTLPCIVVIERGKFNAIGDVAWRAMGGEYNSGGNALERYLGYELAKAAGRLPNWATYGPENVKLRSAERAS